MTVYFYYGEEDYNIDLELDKMRSKLNPDFISMSYQVLDNPNYQDLITILRTPPMMFGETLIVINAEKYFMNSKKNSDEEIAAFDDYQLEDIEDALKNNPENLNVVFVVKLPRDENKKIDSRRKLYKILNKFNSQEFPVIKTYKTDELSNWIIKRAKSKSLTIKKDAVDLLIEQIGNNLRQFDIELEKLQLISYPENIVTKSMVQDISISNQDLFNLTDYIMSGDKGRALLELKLLLDKKHPLELLSALQTMIRKWIIIKTQSAFLSPFELSKFVNMTDYAVKETIKKLKNISAAELVKLKENLFYIEYKIKNAESIDMVSEVECALIR